MDFTLPFGQWLKEQRARLDLTQGDLARRVGYSPETIRKIEAGALRPSKQMVDLLADHLGVPSAQRDAFLAFANDTRTAKSQAKPNNLPVPATPLVGRSGDVAAALKLLKRHDVRLVTMVGPPGVGKTRLAIEIAREACDGYADGVTFVELAPITDHGLVGSTIAHACGLKDAFGQTLIESLGQHLREQHKLLVVDNFEHVLPAASLVGQALSAAPRLKVLVTSREPLRLTGEHRYDVPPLALPGLNGHDKVSRVADSPAVEVFVQRAIAAMPSFALSERNADAVAGICHKLDGLPLAIELAAPRVTLMTPHELLARLDRQLAVLSVGAQDLPLRQRTLRATIDWSYNLLSPAEQALLRRMAVFAGDCTLEAIEAVCQPESESQTALIEGVATLMEKNLLTRVEGANNQSRYGMLEMIREYSTEKLVESGEADRWRLRHAEYFLMLAQSISSIPTHDSSAHALAAELIRPELGNVRGATMWSLASANYVDIGYRLVPALRRCFFFFGGSGEEWRLLQQLMIRPQGAGDSSGRAYALTHMAIVLAFLGDFSLAQESLEEALKILRILEDERQIAYVLERLGWLARERADFSTARAYLKESLSLCRALGDSQGTAEALTTLGEVAVMQEDVEWASDVLTQSLTLHEKHGNLEGTAWTLNHLGHVAQLQADYVRAIALHEQSLLLPWRVLCLMAHPYQSLGEIALSQGDAARAKAHLVKSLTLFRQMGDLMGLSWCLASLAGAYALDKELERGARLWGAGEALHEQVSCRIAPASRPNRERTVALLRQQLGEAEFARLTAEGAQMTVDEAVAFALGET